MSSIVSLHDPSPDSALIRLEPKYGAIICVPCGNGYPLNAIHIHLARTPHYCCKKRRDGWLADLELSAVATDWASLAIPEDGTTPIDGIKVRDGYACKHCTFRTCSDQRIRRHMVTRHPAAQAF